MRASLKNELYRELGRTAFRPRPSPLLPAHVRFTHPYDHAHLETLVRERLGELPLSATHLYPSGFRGQVAVTAVAANQTPSEPVLFKSYAVARSDTTDRSDVPVWLAARATSAAPTYFEPVTIERARDGAAKGVEGEGGEVKLQYMDGGLVANNPALVGYSELLALHGPQAAGAVVVVSIGTGVLCAHDEGRRSKGGRGV